MVIRTGCCAALLMISGVVCADGHITEPALCPKGQPVDINATVYFPTGSSRLSDDDRAALNGALRRLSTLDTGYGMGKLGAVTGVDSVGHTDSRGGTAANERLGLRRAAAVRDHLAERGVPAEAVNVQSFGESQPIADNASSEGRALNRRAELTMRTLQAQ